MLNLKFLPKKLEIETGLQTWIAASEKRYPSYQVSSICINSSTETPLAFAASPILFAKYFFTSSYEKPSIAAYLASSVTSVKLFSSENSDTWQNLLTPVTNRNRSMAFRSFRTL